MNDQPGEWAGPHSHLKGPKTRETWSLQILLGVPMKGRGSPSLDSRRSVWVSGHIPAAPSQLLKVLLHFANKDTEAQRGQATYTATQSRLETGLGPEPTVSRSCPLGSPSPTSSPLQVRPGHFTHSGLTVFPVETPVN